MTQVKLTSSQKGDQKHTHKKARDFKENKIQTDEFETGYFRLVRNKYSAQCRSRCLKGTDHGQIKKNGTPDKGTPRYAQYSWSQVCRGKGKERQGQGSQTGLPCIAHQTWLMMTFESASATGGCDSKGQFLVPCGNRFQEATPTMEVVWHWQQQT